MQSPAYTLSKIAPRLKSNNIESSQQVRPAQSNDKVLVYMPSLSSCTGNIMLASSSAEAHGFCAKVSDFGLAREMDIQSHIATQTTGTVTYMPPETIADGMVSKVSTSNHC